jgi:hypothetical protein
MHMQMHAATLTAAAAAVLVYSVYASKAKPYASETSNINNHLLTDTTDPPPRLPAAGTAVGASSVGSSLFPVHGEARRVVLVLELLGLQALSMPAIGTGVGSGSASTSTPTTASTTCHAAVCTEATMIQKKLHVS